ncbi:hypothetical protein Cgig2_005104 [Carnegiea gigantea]|uniref:Uncharacterized protein n=1 Tax=Carnegiea gigantea TaxID=171969 RepID=A0A9Q1L080_9CARY|nr:hypothetical protein Cgig2_005104 [Carnegiea gigantea]
MMMMMLIDSTMAVQLRSSSPIAYCRPIWGSDDVVGGNFAVPWNKIKRLRKKFDNSFNRRRGSAKNRIQASGKYLGSASDKGGDSSKSRYHPFEDILESEAAETGERRLTAAETSRTIVEVNSQATLLFSGLVNEEVHENIFWPDLPYLTDEHGSELELTLLHSVLAIQGFISSALFASRCCVSGLLSDIYFQVNNDEDIMRTLTSDDNYVDWVDILDSEEDQGDSDGSLGDWAKLETMRSAHPMYFAKKISEVASDEPIDFMEQPPVGLAIQGLLRPAFIEERFVTQQRRPNHPDRNPAHGKAEKAAVDNIENATTINGHAHESSSSEDYSLWTEDLEKDNGLANGTSFYKLEMIKIRLISAHGYQIAVEIEDYSDARPDAIAHSAAKVISRVNAAGEKTTNALKSLCWRCKGLQVQEAALIGIDSLGFDLRVCSGTQVQTLRFVFNSRVFHLNFLQNHLKVCRLMLDAAGKTSVFRPNVIIKKHVQCHLLHVELSGVNLEHIICKFIRASEVSG